MPKTLVFAKDDCHAEDIVRIVREEFGKGNDFCQKITYQDDRQEARGPAQPSSATRYNPRIAVTVDMIATGTDVKPLECLFFMRNVKLAAYFEQMKGRGVRVIDADDAAERHARRAGARRTSSSSMPSASASRTRRRPKPLDRKPSVPLDKLLQMAAQGIVHPDLVSTLAARLARLDQEMTPAQHQEFASEAGKTLHTLTADLLASIDPDRTTERAAAKFNLPPGTEPTEKQLDEAEREAMASALKPLHDPKLRETILASRRTWSRSSTK